MSMNRYGGREFNFHRLGYRRVSLLTKCSALCGLEVRDPWFGES